MACSHTQAAPVPSVLSLGEVLRAGLPAYARRHRLPAAHWKVLNAIQACRTARLGGHRYVCAHCGCAQVVAHGCGNRHCPTCQGINSRHWLEAQRRWLLPVPYFHEVFTLPHQLNPLIQQNQQVLYRAALRGGLRRRCCSSVATTWARNWASRPCCTPGARP